MKRSFIILLLTCLQPLEFKAAASSVLSSTESLPKKPKDLIMYGLFEFEHNANVDLAKECFLNALHINPQKKILRYVIPSFINKLRINHLDDHIIDFSQKVLAVIPDFIDVHVRLARTYQCQGLMDKAIIHYKKALLPHDAISYYLLGSAYLLKTSPTKSDLIKAKKNIKTAIKINPDKGSYLHALSTAYALLNQDTKSVNTLVNAVKKGDQFSLITLATCRLQGTGGGYSPKSAATLFKTALNQPDIIQDLDTNIISWNVKWVCAIHQDKQFIEIMANTDIQLPTAITGFERMAKETARDKDRDELYHTLGILYKRAAKYETNPIKKRNLLFKAKIAFDTVCKLQGEFPTNPRYLYYKAKTELSCAKLLQSNIKEAAEKAKAIYEKIISDHKKKNPHNYFVMRAYFKLSSIHTNIFEDPETGSAYLKKSSDLSRRCFKNLYTLILQPTDKCHHDAQTGYTK
jgi:tetratricopeptide (TPR) repeat protein